MKEIKERFLRSWSRIDTVEEKVFRIVLVVGMLSALVTIIAGLIQKLPVWSNLVTGAILVFFAGIQCLSRRHPEHERLWRTLLVVGINFVLFPICFFASGGIYSGMIMFYLLGIYLVSLLVAGNLGGIIFVLSVLVLELSVTLSRRFPSLVSEMTPLQHYQDVKVTLFLSAVSLYAISMLVLMAYRRERQEKDALNEKLRNLSMRDALSGLYNRRELFRRLEVMYGGEEHERSETLTRHGAFIAMFDIDNFKHLNDTYGHSFGDEVLVSVSKTMFSAVRAENGEIASRYGGEEFVLILFADSMDEVYARMDKLRDDISCLRWDEVPTLSVSVSGGLISCEKYEDITVAMHDVDELLYRAKASGKNRIIVMDQPA